MDHLELRDITVTHQGKTILQNIHCLIRKGELLLIQGASGSGKSTLLKAILGFARGCTGDIRLDGRLVTAATIRAFRRQCAYVGQKALVFQGTVKAYLDLPFSFRNNRHARPDMAECVEMLASLGFTPDILTHTYPCLSAGEQQRITIAQALLLNRPIYLLDEVTSCLDASNTRQVIDLVTASRDRTMLVVSHKTVWEPHATSIVTIKQGRMHLKEGTG